MANPQDIVARPEVYDQIVELVAEMLAKRWRESAIRGALEELNGKPVSYGTVKSLVSSARALMTRRADATLAEQRAASIAFYEAIIADDKLDVEARMRAQDALNRMLGINVPAVQARPTNTARSIIDAVKRMEAQTIGARRATLYTDAQEVAARADDPEPRPAQQPPSPM